MTLRTTWCSSICRQPATRTSPWVGRSWEQSRLFWDFLQKIFEITWIPIMACPTCSSLDRALFLTLNLSSRAASFFRTCDRGMRRRPQLQIIAAATYATSARLSRLISPLHFPGWRPQMRMYLPRKFTRQRWAVGCLRVFFRKRVSGADCAIPSMPTLRPTVIPE